MPISNLQKNAPSHRPTNALSNYLFHSLTYLFPDLKPTSPITSRPYGVEYPELDEKLEDLCDFNISRTKRVRSRALLLDLFQPIAPWGTPLPDHRTPLLGLLRW